MSRLFCSVGGESTAISDQELRSHLKSFVAELGERDHVLLLPPDFTRFHSQSGKITEMISELFGCIEPSSPDATTNNNKDPPTLQILPALGTHAPMTEPEIERMFGSRLASKKPSPFMVHDWRNDVVTIGHVSNEMVKEATRGMVDEPWPAQLNKVVWEQRNKPKSVVISVGQVVPHEVLGMANYNKNLFVGVGGLAAINLSHFIGAVHGMENLMGKGDNPLRAILNKASEDFLGSIELYYVLTVMGTDAATGKLEMRGLFIGNDIECYKRACDLSSKINFIMLDRAPKKVVVYLDPDEFHSTWLGNKSIYRTRMAIDDGGELIVLAPGVKKFGEDGGIDVLIRKYGYVGTPAIMKAMNENIDLKDSLGTVAHLIHGSSEGRFSVTYCPGHLTKAEIESVGFKYADLNEMMATYDIEKLKDGWNSLEEEEIFYISNPALGLWASKSRFASSSSPDETGSNKKPRIDE